MKAVAILVLWFSFIITVSILASCGSAHSSCDAYGQTQQLPEGDLASK